MKLVERAFQQVLNSVAVSSPRSLVCNDAICYDSAKQGALSIQKNSGLKFRKLHVLNGTVHAGCTDPTQATARFVIVDSQHTHNYAL